MSDLKMRNHVGLFVFRVSAYYNKSTARISVYVIMFIAPYFVIHPYFRVSKRNLR